MPQKTVAVLGTLDSKGAEFAFLCDRLRAAGVVPLVIDAGVLGASALPPDIPASDVAAAGGAPLADLVAAKDRGRAVAVMSAGAAAVVRKLHADGRIDGIVSMGGGGGTVIGTAAMRVLPVGVPKLMLSTIAAGDISRYVDVKDITMMPSVVDIAGLNRLSKRIIANAAGAIAGMVAAKPPAVEGERPLVHATGTGGRAMEELIRGGFIAGVLDLTTTELADELAGGILSAGPDRLEAAGLAGIPQVVSVGALDMVNFGAPDTVPERYRGRSFYRHNPMVTLMRTTPEENAALGRIIAEKLARATGPTVLMIPKRGVSAIDIAGKPFFDPAADAALFEALKAECPPNVELVEIDAAINDDAFAVAAAERLLALMRR